MFSFLTIANRTTQTEEEKTSFLCRLVGQDQQGGDRMEHSHADVRLVCYELLTFKAHLLTSNQEYCGVTGWPPESNSWRPKWRASKADIYYRIEGPRRWFYSQRVVHSEDEAMDGDQAGTGWDVLNRNKLIWADHSRLTCAMLSGLNSTWILKGWVAKIRQICLAVIENFDKSKMNLKKPGASWLICCNHQREHGA